MVGVDCCWALRLSFVGVLLCVVGLDRLVLRAWGGSWICCLGFLGLCCVGCFTCRVMLLLVCQGLCVSFRFGLLVCGLWWLCSVFQGLV